MIASGKCGTVKDATLFQTFYLGLWLFNQPFLHNNLMYKERFHFFINLKIFVYLVAILFSFSWLIETSF